MRALKAAIATLTVLAGGLCASEALACRRAWTEPSYSAEDIAAEVIVEVETVTYLEPDPGEEIVSFFGTGHWTAIARVKSARKGSAPTERVALNGTDQTYGCGRLLQRPEIGSRWIVQYGKSPSGGVGAMLYFFPAP